MIKKLFSIITVISAFTLFTNSVFATENLITPAQIISEVNNSNIISARNNTETNAIDYYIDSNYVLSMPYTSDYLLFSKSPVTINQTAVENSVDDEIILGITINSILKLSGYENKSISEDIKNVHDFDTYGLDIKTQNYNLTGEDNGGSWNTSGDIITYAKMSLDKNKISVLMDRFGEDIQHDNFIGPTIPLFEAKNITDSSVTLYPQAFSESGESLKCDIYRSSSQSGEYTKITSSPISCTNGGTYTDTNLSANTTYYYKAKIVDQDLYSSVLTVKTASKSSTSTTAPSETNPKTGITDYLVGFITVLTATIIALIITHKNKLFKQI